MLIVNEGLLVAAALEACDAKKKGFKAKLKASGAARKLSPLLSLSGVGFGLIMLGLSTKDDKFMS